MKGIRAVKSIADILTSPNRVACSLEWRKSSGCLLSISVTKEYVNLAIAPHPSLQQEMKSLPSITLVERKVYGLNKKELDDKVLTQLNSILRNHNVCGMVVHWPVQEEGRCGARCGRVLRFLDQLTAAQIKSNNQFSIFDESRPICLYDANHYTPTEDMWGRSPLYSRTTDKTMHFTSKEQYKESCETDGQAVMNVWNDFCRTYWPDLFVEPSKHSSDSDYESDFDEPLIAV